jgi:hypothetical protein
MVYIINIGHRTSIVNIMNSLELEHKSLNIDLILNTQNRISSLIRNKMKVIVHNMEGLKELIETYLLGINLYINLN